MGYKSTINTILRVNSSEITSVSAGSIFTASKAGGRIYPVGLAIVLCDENWKFYGYATVRKSIITSETSLMEVEILTVFAPGTAEIIKTEFLKAGVITGEVND